jgi:hypothetical protein
VRNTPSAIIQGSETKVGTRCRPGASLLTTEPQAGKSEAEAVAETMSACGWCPVSE